MRSEYYVEEFKDVAARSSDAPWAADDPGGGWTPARFSDDDDDDDEEEDATDDDEVPAQPRRSSSSSTTAATGGFTADAAAVVVGAIRANVRSASKYWRRPARPESGLEPSSRSAWIQKRRPEAETVAGLRRLTRRPSSKSTKQPARQAAAGATPSTNSTNGTATTTKKKLGAWPSGGARRARSAGFAAELDKARSASATTSALQQQQQQQSPLYKVPAVKLGLWVIEAGPANGDWQSLESTVIFWASSNAAKYMFGAAEDGPDLSGVALHPNPADALHAGSLPVTPRRTAPTTPDETPPPRPADETTAAAETASDASGERSDADDLAKRAPKAARTSLGSVGARWRPRGDATEEPELVWIAGQVAATNDASAAFVCVDVDVHGPIEADTIDKLRTLGVFDKFERGDRIADAPQALDACLEPMVFVEKGSAKLAEGVVPQFAETLRDPDADLPVIDGETPVVTAALPLASVDAEQPSSSWEAASQASSSASSGSPVARGPAPKRLRLATTAVCALRRASVDATGTVFAAVRSNEEEPGEDPTSGGDPDDDDDDDDVAVSSDDESSAGDEIAELEALVATLQKPLEASFEARLAAVVADFRNLSLDTEPCTQQRSYDDVPPLFTQQVTNVEDDLLDGGGGGFDDDDDDVEQVFDEDDAWAPPERIHVSPTFVVISLTTPPS
mmetsp:Transcript_10186/g.41242  ORF Transcript_10186/g.41242 Transcript_10186/m.41242 type:complete len:680 (-) Transcript_10186:1029-3068(-)